MSTSNTWATVVSKLGGVGVYGATLGSVTASKAATMIGGTNLVVYIPESAYYIKNESCIVLPINKFAAAAYDLLYRWANLELTSASTDGKWISSSGKSVSHYYIRVDSIKGKRALFGAYWAPVTELNAGNVQESWTMNPGGLCKCFGMTHHVNQTNYPYYVKNWYEDEIFWLPCDKKSTKYRLTIYYILNG